MKKDVKVYIRAFYEKNHLCFAVAAVLRILDGLGMLLISWLLGAVVDTIATGSLARLWYLLKLTAVMALGYTVLEIAYSRAQAAFIHRGLARYKALAFRNISQKSISAFSQENTGRYISVLTNDVGTLEENYLGQTFELIAQPLTFVGTLIMMFWYSPVLAASAIGLCLLPLTAALLFSGEMNRREKTVSDQNEDFVGKLKDLLAGFAVTKSFKAEDSVRGIFEAENTALENTKRNRRRWQGCFRGVAGSMGLVLQFGIFFIGAYLAIRGSITAGTVLIFVNLCNSLISPVQTVPQYWAARKAARGLIEKLAEVTRENASRCGETIQPVLRDAIAFQNVTFGYEPDTPVLKNISLRLEAGKKYALVGASGSGKSTLLNLLMGAYDGYEGQLTVDGKELREIDPDSLYDLMSLIGQNVFLFDDTVHRNITMFREFRAEQVSSAVERAGLSELIAQRGEDYRCGENGAGLSGGERQRISIARCLLRGTPVLLLDEATAALDNQTAFAVTDKILRLEGLTRLVVTHRLEAALLAQYDEIFVLRDGCLCERGTFDALMDRKAYFYSLYTVCNG